MIGLFKKAITIAIVATAVGAFSGTGTMMMAHAEDMYGSSMLRGITVATGTGYGIMADNIQMVSNPRLECWNKCRGQGGLKSECRKRCGIPPEG